MFALGESGEHAIFSAWRHHIDEAKKLHFQEAARIIEICADVQCERLTPDFLRQGLSFEAVIDRLSGRLKLSGKWPPAPFKDTL